MTVHQCPVCHLRFRYATEMESHARDEHGLELGEPEREELHRWARASSSRSD